MDNRIYIYTDGACSGNPGKGGWAAVILDSNLNQKSISGGESNPPKINGKLNFKDDWSQTAFALAINLSKKGFFEMEEFRQLMNKTIKEWENNHDLEDKSWNYYEIWVSVLEKLIYEKEVLNRSEVSSFFKKIIDNYSNNHSTHNLQSNLNHHHSRCFRICLLQYLKTLQILHILLLVLLRLQQLLLVLFP